MTPLPNGKIIRAWINGQGDDPDWKIRPAVIINYDEQEDRYAVLVGTHKLRPNDKARVPIASGRSGLRATGLPEKTEVNCTWFEWVDREQIEEVNGDLPPRELDAVMKRFRDLGNI